MAEYGYSCCASRTVLLDFLNQPDLKRDLTEEQVAKALTMMARYHS